MPQRYEAIRDFYVRQGLSLKAAKTKGAKIFNATRKRGEAPVTGPDRPGHTAARFNDDLKE